MYSDIIRYCGWDIGGAHLKFAGLTQEGKLIAIEQQKCPLWLGVEQLGKALDIVQSKYNLDKAIHAVTMTGELCDNFSDRQTGVEEIVAAISTKLDPRRSILFGLHRHWREFGDLGAAADELASANWYASSSYVANHHSDAIVMDIGSTTVDIVPIVNSKVASKGDSDFSRLKYRELVYTGIVRTPVSSMVQALPFEGSMIPVAAEYFANSADVHRSLDLLPDHVDLYDTADGGEKSKLGSARRLFRMIGRDFDNDRDNDYDSAQSMAGYALGEQLKQIKTGLEFVLAEHDWDRPIAVIGLGCGTYLVEKLCAEMGIEYCNFDTLIDSNPQKMLGHTPAYVCAPAVAVAYLLQSDRPVNSIN